MMSIEHEAPLELLRRDPLLAAVLLRGLGVTVPAGATASMAPTDLSASVPTELRADAVILLSGPGGTRQAVIVEVQLRYDQAKVYSWPAYLAQVRTAHRCPAILLVICPDTATARRCRGPIRTGHPGFDLIPLVIDAETTPPPDAPGQGEASPELAVLAAFTGAIDLEQDAGRRMVLGALAAAHLDEERLKIYTHLIRAVASASARGALEVLMTTAFKDDFFDRIEAKVRAEVLNDEFLNRIKAEGKAEAEAEGEARMILRVLSARGLQVPDEIRQRVLSCSDLSQLEIWGDRAATASSVDDVFGG